MRSASTSCSGGRKIEKFPLAPASPKKIPVFDITDAAALIFVRKSKPCSDRMSVPINSITKNVSKNDVICAATSADTVLPPTFTETIARG